MQDNQESEILNSAALLFHKYGIKKTTMEDIAGGASMGKSTLYYYFKSKDEVYEMVLRGELKEFQQIITCALSDYHSAEQMITMFIKAVFNRITGFPNLLHALLEESASKKAAAITREFEVWQSGRIEELLRHGVSTGEFRNMEESELLINCQAIGIAMFGIRGALIKEKDHKAFENKLDSLIFLLLNGIGQLNK